MNRFFTPVILITMSLAYSYCEPLSESSMNAVNSLLDADSDVANNDPGFDKRIERYAFGLGRRSYTYSDDTQGRQKTGKRLPGYNFGLGKRAPPYDFGMGKLTDKRAQPYDFGMGKLTEKRAPLYDMENPQYMDENEANIYEPYYYAGSKRTRPYSFGLGKRGNAHTDRYSFGLGKRDLRPERYAFGLGKRQNSHLAESKFAEEAVDYRR